MEHRACPRDGTHLAEHRVEHVNADVCPKCAGTFFDGAELRKVTGLEDLAVVLADQRGTRGAPTECPACETLMHVDSLGRVEIDHCPSCLGVWLDAGEMEKLAARGPPPPPAPPPAKPTSAEHRAAVERALQTLAAKLHPRA